MNRIMGIGVFHVKGVPELHVMYCGDDNVGRLKQFKGSCVCTKDFIISYVSKKLECKKSEVKVSNDLLKRFPIKVT